MKRFIELNDDKESGVWYLPLGNGEYVIKDYGISDEHYLGYYELDTNMIDDGVVIDYIKSNAGYTDEEVEEWREDSLELWKLEYAHSEGLDYSLWFRWESNKRRLMKAGSEFIRHWLDS